MLNHNTASQLREMKMSVMARAFEKQLGDTTISSMSFEERFGLLVDIEHTTRKNNRLKRLIRGANYSMPDASLEDIEYLALKDECSAEIDSLIRKVAELKAVFNSLLFCKGCCEDDTT